jgi:hypothetical protein
VSAWDAEPRSNGPIDGDLAELIERHRLLIA